MLRVLTLIIGLSSSGMLLANPADWISQSQFFAYTPSEFRFVKDKPVSISRNSIEQDLQVLRPYSTGLILYATDQNTQTIVESAQKLKFQSMILGIWAVTDKNEIKQAVDLSRRYPKLIKAIAIGNEGLFFRRYTRAQLQQAFAYVRRELPDMALATTEPFASYLGNPALLDCSAQDFLLPNIHPAFESWFNPEATVQSVEFVMNVTARLIALCRKEVLIKETGLPSGPANRGYSVQLQRAFWETLQKRIQGNTRVSVAMFEAFDASWKVAEMKKQTGKHDERERYWGWFEHDRTPKEMVELLKPIKH